MSRTKRNRFDSIIAVEKISNKLFGDTYAIAGDVKTALSEIMITCRKCGKTKTTTIAKFIAHSGCDCSRDRKLSDKTKQKMSKSKKGHTYNRTDEELFIKKAIEVHGSKKYKYTRLQFTGLLNEIRVYCKKHAKVFTVIARTHLAGAGCPICNDYKHMSKGEIAIFKYLTKSKIDFEQEYSFPGCVYRYKLPFDFYIPSLNTAIEFDGQQHFHPIGYFGGEEELTIRQERDRIKDQFCFDNKIHLIRIKYDCTDIDKVLRMEFEKISNKEQIK